MMKSTWTKTRSSASALAAFALALSMTACSADPEAPVESANLDEWTLVEEGRDEADALAEAAAAAGDEGVPGENSDAVIEKAGCVHIQWCNEPGPVGTVCIWDACSLAAAVSECTADARAVCGGITQPAEIR